MYASGCYVLPLQYSALLHVVILFLTHSPRARPRGLTDIPGTPSGQMPSLKPEDLQYFGDLLQDKELDAMSAEEARDRRIKTLLLKVRCVAVLCDCSIACI